VTNLSTATRRPKGLRTFVLVAGAIAAIGVAGVSIWTVASGVRQGLAYLSLTSALEEHQAASAAYKPVGESLAVEGVIAGRDLELAQRLGVLAEDRYVGADAKAAFLASTEAFVVLEADVAQYEPGFEAIVLPSYSTSDLDAAAAEARTQADWFREHLDGAADLDVALVEGKDELATAAEAMFASAGAVAPAYESANWVATVDSRLGFRRSVSNLTDATLDTAGISALQRYIDATVALEASHQAEVASFAGPLFDNRIAAQAFANSIAGGVILDFDWVPELFGYGGNNGMAGQATLESDGTNFYSSITLTDSVAERWGGGASESITAHEVGHAITMKCIDIFNAHFAGDYEAFATAWAIGMGYTNNANGTSAYGRPSDDLVAVTLSCR
jgi:hypothetical protein